MNVDAFFFMLVLAMTASLAGAYQVLGRGRRQRELEQRELIQSSRHRHLPRGLPKGLP
jgi:hypothetical protein